MIEAFDVFAKYYRRWNASIDAEFARITHGVADPFEQVALAGHLPRTVKDYPQRILTQHLYGVDIDFEAAEIATLNLVMRAFRELRTLGRPESKLPLILNQNVKVGNTLVQPHSFTASEWADSFADTARALIELRMRVSETTDDDERLGLITAAMAAAEEVLAQYDPIAETLGKPFDWYLGFPEVWFDPAGQPLANGGFTVVVGNPPYVRIQELKKWIPDEVEFYRSRYAAASVGNYDVYTVFVERALELLQGNGQLGFILPHRFFSMEYGQPLRKMLSDQQLVRKIVHFGSCQIFDGATTYTALLFLARGGEENLEFTQVTDLTHWRETGAASTTVVPSTELSEGPWNIATGAARPIRLKVATAPLILGDVAKVFVGVQTSADDIYHMDFLGVNGEHFLLRCRVDDSTHLIEQQAVIPLLSGTDIGPFRPLPTRQYIIFPYDVVGETASLIPFDQLQSRWPKVAAYLTLHRVTLEARERGRFSGTAWHQYGRNQNLGIQGRQKVCVPRMVPYLYATFDARGTHVLDNVDVGGVTVKDGSPYDLPALLGILNSSIVRWYFPFISVRFRGDYLGANRQFLSLIPLPEIGLGNAAVVHEIGTVAIELLSACDALAGEAVTEPGGAANLTVRRLERQLNKAVFELYGLNADEVQVVENALRAIPSLSP